MSSFHEDFYASLVSFCQDQVSTLISNGVSSTLQYVDYDAHSQLVDLPKTDLLGIASLHWSNDGHFFDVGCSVGCSVWDDTNLFRHRKILGWVTSLLIPSSEIPLLDADTGDKKGWLRVSGSLAVMPMTTSEQRSLQFILAEFQTSRTS